MPSEEEWQRKVEGLERKLVLAAQYGQKVLEEKVQLERDLTNARQQLEDAEGELEDLRLEAQHRGNASDSLVSDDDAPVVARASSNKHRGSTARSSTFPALGLNGFQQRSSAVHAQVAMAEEWEHERQGLVAEKLELIAQVKDRQLDIAELEKRVEELQHELESKAQEQSKEAASGVGDGGVAGGKWAKGLKAVNSAAKAQMVAEECDELRQANWDLKKKSKELQEKYAESKAECQKLEHEFKEVAAQLHVMQESLEEQRLKNGNLHQELVKLRQELEHERDAKDFMTPRMNPRGSLDFVSECEGLGNVASELAHLGDDMSLEQHVREQMAELQEELDESKAKLRRAKVEAVGICRALEAELIRANRARGDFTEQLQAITAEGKELREQMQRARDKDAEARRLAGEREALVQRLGEVQQQLVASREGRGPEAPEASSKERRAESEAQAKEEVQALASRLAELERSLAEAQREGRRLREAAEQRQLALVRQAGDADPLLGDLKEQIVQSVVDKEDLTRSMDELKTKLEKASKAVVEVEKLKQEHERAERELKEHLEQAKEEALEGLRAEHTRTVEGLVSSHEQAKEEALEGLRAEHTRTVEGLVSSHEQERRKTLSEKDTEVARKLSELMAAHEEELRRLQDSSRTAEEELRRLQDSSRTAEEERERLERSMSELQARLEKERDDALQEAKAAHQRELDATRSELRKSVHESQAEHERRLAELREAHEQELRQLADTGRKSEEDRLRTEMAMADLKARMEKEHQAALEQLRQEQARAVDELKASQASASSLQDQAKLLEGLHADSERAMDELRKAHQQELAKQRANSAAAKAAAEEAELGRQQAVAASDAASQAAQEAREALQKQTSRCREKEQALQQRDAEAEELRRSVEQLQRQLDLARERLKTAGNSSQKRKSDSSTRVKEMQRELLLLQGQQRRADEWEQEARRFAALRREMMQTIEELRSEVGSLRKVAKESIANAVHCEHGPMPCGECGEVASEAQLFRAVVAARLLEGELRQAPRVTLAAPAPARASRRSLRSGGPRWGAPDERKKRLTAAA